jgi:uncharacterized protein (DUF58 family)
VSPDDVAAEVRRIEITTRHLVRDIVAGEYTAAFRGRGVEFAEVREYQPGDDVRTIDWNVTARLGSAYVKRFLEERELTVLFVVDYSASGAFGSGQRSKRALAVEVCAVIALAAARSNDRVGAAFFTDRLERYVPPRKGRRQVLRVISELLAYEPSGRGTDLAGSLRALEPLLRRRSVVFIASDFLAIRVTDPRERELPEVGLVALRDVETGDWAWVDTGSPAVRKHLQARAASFDAELEQDLHESRSDLLRLDAGEPYGEPLIGFFRRRERMQWR